MKDLSYSHKTAVALSLPLTVVLLAAVAVPYVLLHGFSTASLPGMTAALLIGPVFAASIVVHELLHAVAAMMAGGLRWSDIRFGVNWATLTPYAHPTKAITARAYFVTAAAPGLILGVAPAAYGIATGSAVWSWYGALMLAAAAGDLIVIWSLRATPASALVQDHPTRVGCRVVPADGGVLPDPEPEKTESDVFPPALLKGLIGALLFGVFIGTAAAVAALLNK